MFIKHTKTGNPLVDSVAEHQPGSADAYFRYLHYPFYVAPVGFCVAVAHFFSDGRSAAALFLPLYAAVAYYFANRMVRLIIFLGPIASSLTGIAVGYVMDDALANIGWSSRTSRTETTIRATVGTTPAPRPPRARRGRRRARSAAADLRVAARSGLSFEDGVRKPS